MSVVCLFLMLQNFSTQISADLKFEVRLKQETKSLLPKTEDAKIALLLKNQSLQGSWSDINYHDSSIVNWKPLAHLERTYQIIAAAETENWNDTSKTEAIRHALDFYTSYTYPAAKCVDRRTMKLIPSPCFIQSRNWWYNHVGEGLLLGKILLLTNDHFPDSTCFRWSQHISSTLQSITDSTIYVGGANLFWEGEALIYKALVQHDTTLVDSVLNLFQSASRLATPEEGIQPDMSFNQHGFIQTGGYGIGALEMTARWIRLTDSTSRQWPLEERRHLIDFALDGCIPLIDHGIFDPGSIGREISRNISHKSDAMAQILSELSASSDGYRSKEIKEAQDFLKTGDWPWPQKRGTIYPSNYFLIYHGNGWTFSWHGCPNGKKGTELVNDENLQGMLLPLGCYWIRNKEQDSRLFPLLDWNHLPGTTLPQDYHPPTSLFKVGNNSLPPKIECTKSKCQIDYDFDIDGISGHQNIEVQKDMIQVSGSHFHSAKGEPLFETNVDQRLVVGPVIVRDSQGRAHQLIESDSNFSSLECDGFIYTFPVGTEVTAQIRNIQSAWRSINKSESSAIIKHKILSIIIKASAYQFSISSQRQRNVSGKM